MNKAELIQAGALAQRHFSLKPNFEVMEIASDEKRTIVVMGQIDVKTDDISSPFGTMPKTQQITLSAFANASTHKRWYMGYADKLNILVVQEL